MATTSTRSLPLPAAPSSGSPLCPARETAVTAIVVIDATRSYGGRAAAPAFAANARDTLTARQVSADGPQSPQEISGFTQGCECPRLIVASPLPATERLALSRLRRSVPVVVLDGTYGSRSKQVLRSKHAC